MECRHEKLLITNSIKMNAKKTHDQTIRKHTPKRKKKRKLKIRKYKRNKYKFLKYKTCLVLSSALLLTSKGRNKTCILTLSVKNMTLVSPRTTGALINWM